MTWLSGAENAIVAQKTNVTDRQNGHTVSACYVSHGRNTSNDLSTCL